MKKTLFMLSAVLAFATAQAQTEKKIIPETKRQSPPPSPANSPDESTKTPSSVISEDGTTPVSPTPYDKDKAKDEHVKSYPATERIKDTVAEVRKRKTRNE